LKRLLVALIVAAVACAAALLGGIFVLDHRFDAPGPLAEARTLIIPRGVSREAIAYQLAQTGVLAEP